MDSTPKTKKAMMKDEVILFIDLIHNFPIITSKETNASNNKLKEEAWSELTSSYNSKCGRIPRTKEQLKLKWDNLKKAARKRAQSIKMNMMKTGGGKADYIPPDEILDKVTTMMGSTCTGFAVPFGGDGIGADELCADTVFIPLDAAVHEEIHATSNSTASAQMPENDFLPEQREVKKRKINFSTPDGDVGEQSRAQFLYGMPTMAKSLKNKGKNQSRQKSNDDGRLEKNIAIANYFTKLTEKTEIEILLLKKQLENMENAN